MTPETRFCSPDLATSLLPLIDYWSVVVLDFVLYVSYRSGNRLTEERAGTHG